MLDTLWTAGVEVPRVLDSSSNAILMEFVGDEVQGAPTLHSVGLERDEACTLFDCMIRNIEAMLACYVVHADLSPYNVLYWQGDLRVIDLPQAVDALRHPQGFELFSRDIDRLARYFQRQGVDVDPTELAMDLWKRAYG